jgi:hypothetical protein
VVREIYWEVSKVVLSKIGFDTYQKIMNEAIEELGKRVQGPVSHRE